MADAVRMVISEPAPRGICEVCGEKAYAPQAKRCEEHRGQKQPKRNSAIDDAIRTNTGAPEPDIKRVTPPPPVGIAGDEAKQARVRELIGKIETEVNPGLAQGLAFVCQPIPSINFYKEVDGRVVPNHFGEAVTFNGFEAWVLGNAAAELEGSPMIGTVKTVAGPVVPIALAIGAAFLVGAKGYRVWNLREQIMEQHRREQAATAPGAEADKAATEAAQAAESERAAQAGPSVRAEADAQAARRAADVEAQTEAAPVNRTRAETIDVDLGVAQPPAIPAEELPDVIAESDAELADLFQR